MLQHGSIKACVLGSALLVASSTALCQAVPKASAVSGTPITLNALGAGGWARDRFRQTRMCSTSDCCWSARDRRRCSTTTRALLSAVRLCWVGGRVGASQRTISAVVTPGGLTLRIRTRTRCLSTAASYGSVFGTASVVVRADGVKSIAQYGIYCPQVGQQIVGVGFACFELGIAAATGPANTPGIVIVGTQRLNILLPSGCGLHTNPVLTSRNDPKRGCRSWGRSG